MTRDRRWCKAENVCKSFGRVEVLKGIDLEVAPREVFCSSGRPARASRRSCAASTTSRRSTPAGSASTASWSATASAATSSTSCASARSPRSGATIGMVFQRFNLFPHMTALENVIEAPVRVKGESKADGARHARSELLDRVGLGRQGRRATRPSSPAASSSASRSPGRWRWSRS